MDVQIQLNTFVNTTLYKMEDLYSLAERALDVAIAEKKFLFKIYDYLQHNKAKRKDANGRINKDTILLRVLDK